MNKLQNNEMWYTFCPNDIKKAGLRALYDLHGEEFEIEYQKAVDLGLGKEINPKSIFDSIIKSQVESGKPYVMFKDNANKNNMQRNIGVIKQSNLCCLDGESIITIINENGGIEKITMEEVVKLHEKHKNIFVLSENNTFQPILGAIKTKENAEVIEIVDEEKNVRIVCTPDHRIFTKNRGYVMACDLLEDDELDTNFN
jgi:ribonucleotide reductase alpha subunit